jgi:uncharacterized protein YbaP (TraB family)
MFMRRLFCGVLLVLQFSFIQAQNVTLKNAKYPSLLWEITGNGLNKPSYLFGTMHVSSKMVFNLSDSFYAAIRSADVVALETNPESWQEDMYQFNFENEFINAASYQTGYHHAPEDYLSIKTLQFSRYQKLIEAALASNPSAINNLLYRTYSERQNDFEEDTYLDLYIYQVGKKWGKRVYGVERYEESMKLAMEAYVDGMKDKNRRERTFDIDDDFSYSKLQDAYRTGNLDLLDTINRLNSFSPAFDEKFLYQRNDIQAASIDSILKSGSSLFVGVGAAHLPGHRGVIEYLRREGYKLRPIKMGQRSSHQKESLEKIKVSVVFETQLSEDGFYKVDVPGKLFRFANAFDGFDQVQYADMANGSYYMVTRVQTNASLWGHTANDVLKKTDSLLYENIPGRILSKEAITKNGYKGFAISNQTRRGDLQRYEIFVTPFEIVIFKVSGTGAYVKSSPVIEQFFASIELKKPMPQWERFSPSFGGFEIEMPHYPTIVKNNNWQFLTEDSASDTHFAVIRTDVHNYNFVEEDSFDLALMEESFTSSEFFDQSVSRKQIRHKGYPALDATYKFKDGSTALVRYVIQGPHYYTLIAQGPSALPAMTRFLESFTIRPSEYGEEKLQTDTILHYSVKTPFYPQKRNAIEMPGGFENLYTGMMDDDEVEMERTIYKDKIISNDTTGERVYISFYKAPRYQYIKDSLDLQRQDRFLNKETSWIIRRKQQIELADGTRVFEYTLGDTNSSRVVWTKTFYRNGVGHTIRTQTDTLTAPGAFLKQFFQTFQPSGKVEGNNPYVKKTEGFFNDFFSGDTLLHKRAAKNVVMVNFDAADVPQLKKAINTLCWKDKNYLAVKKDFIDKLGGIESDDAANLLKDIYYAAGDTIELQYKAMEALVEQKTKFAYRVFKNILLHEPPVLDIGNGYSGNDEERGSFMDGLYDSLELASTIIKDILPLINIDDYKYPVLQLMSALVDSNLLSAKAYASYLPEFLIEAKQALKKQVIVEKRKSIRRAIKNERDDSGNENETAYGNETLSLYATLLMPFADRNASVQPLLAQMLASNDKELKYTTSLLLIRNNKIVPDSVLDFFASDDEYRFLLYEDLKAINKEDIFPAGYHNHVALAKSKLVQYADYDKPDSIVFLERLPLQVKDKKGFIYFFKYKRKKEDNQWKMATAGLIPDDKETFDFGEKSAFYDYDFTGLSEVKFKENEEVKAQLEERKKQLLYSKRPAAKEFYNEGADVDISAMRAMGR